MAVSRLAASCSLSINVSKFTRLRNDLLCVERDVKLYSLTHSLTHYQHGVRLGLTTFTYLFNFIIDVNV